MRRSNRSSTPASRAGRVAPSGRTIRKVPRVAALRVVLPGPAGAAACPRGPRDAIAARISSRDGSVSAGRGRRSRTSPGTRSTAWVSMWRTTTSPSGRPARPRAAAARRRGSARHRCRATSGSCPPPAYQHGFLPPNWTEIRPNDRGNSIAPNTSDQADLASAWPGWSPPFPARAPPATAAACRIRRRQHVSERMGR